ITNADANPPFASQPSLNNVYFSNPLTSAQDGSTATTVFFPHSLTSLEYNYNIPATAQFSMGVQQQLSPSVVGLVQYVGTLGYHQDDDRAINTLPLNSPNRQGVAKGTFNANLGRIFPGYAGISEEDVNSNSSYDALESELRMQAWHGLSVQVAYTWSHEIDIVSSHLGSVSNPFNIAYDRGSGTLDRRNIFNANYIYQLPFFKNTGNTAEREALGGWQVSGE